MVRDEPTTAAVVPEPADDVASRQRSSYRDAIELMISRHARPTTEQPTFSTPPGLAPGLAELCSRLLQRYERLSVMNRYAEPAVGPLEHLRLLALLDDHRLGEPARPDHD